jgi:hypothetical protein
MPEPFTMIALTVVSINIGKIIYGLGDEIKFQKKIRKKNIKQKQLYMIDINNINHENCSICLETPDDCTQLKCGHVYHKECIHKWLKIKNTCPNCRKIMFFRN